MEYTLRDAGEKMMDMESMPSSKGESKKYYPSLYLNVENLPEIAVWEVGKEYTLIIKVKEESHTIDETHSGSTKESARFEVLKVGAVKSGDDKVEAFVKEKLNLK